MMLHMRMLSTRAAVLRSSLLVSSSSRSSAASVFAAMPTAAAAMRMRALQQQITMVVGARRMLSSSNKSSSKSKSSESFFKRAWTKYMVLLETRPLATKVVSGATIAAIGDINCQVFLEPDSPFDAKRAATFTFLGGAFISPLLHVSYGFLGRALPGTSALAVAKRLALDQLVFAPTFLSVFFSLLLTLEGEADKVPEKLAQDWWPAVKANWVVWVPAQLINFRFVPGSLQVLFSNVIGLFWNAYMSLVSHSDAHAALNVESATAHADELDGTTTATATATAAAAKPLLTN